MNDLDDVEFFEVSISPHRLDDVRQLFREYADEIGINLDFQGFEAELASLPGLYAQPRGTLMLCTMEGQPAGCIAVRPFDDETSELKRMFVRAPFRGMGLAKLMVESALEFSRWSGYRRVLLDTLESMTAARKLYERFGFQQTDAYYDNPLPNVVYYELDFHAAARAVVKRWAHKLGEGKWAVTLYNDSETTMDEVVGIIIEHVRYDAELATALMQLTHFHGSAIIRRYEDRAHAVDVVQRIEAHCVALDIPLKSGVYEVPSK